MLSFKVISESSSERALNSFIPDLSVDEAGELYEIVESLDYSDDEVEYAVSVSNKCAIIRVFDMGRYMFVFPYELSSDADISLAVDAVSEYAMREEITLTFTGVPRDYMPLMLRFRHIDCDAIDPDGEEFSVRVKTECEMLDEIPTVTRGRVTLSPIFEEDVEAYASLSRDSELNKYWGYNYSDDIASPADSYFYESAMAEFARGVSMSMAIRVEESFAGEVVLYAFDGKGCAEFAIRLFPEYHGKGLGEESIRALSEVASSIGLLNLRSVIMKDNIPSIKMLSKITDEVSDGGDRLVFDISLPI